MRTSRAARAVGQRTLVSEKRMLRSAGRRGRAVAPNVRDGLTNKGSLKTGEWFSGCFLDGFCDGRDWAAFIIESYSEGSLKRVWSGDGSSPTASNRAWLICQDAKCRRAADAPLGWFSGCLWSRAGHSRLTIIDAA